MLCSTADAVQRPRMRDVVFEQAREFLTERELVEVLQVVGYYWSFGRISTVLDVEVTRTDVPHSPVCRRGRVGVTRGFHTRM